MRGTAPIFLTIDPDVESKYASSSIMLWVNPLQIKQQINLIVNMITSMEDNK